MKNSLQLMRIKIFHFWNSHGQPAALLFQTTQYDRLSQQQLVFLFV